MENLSFTLQELFEEIKDRAFTDGAFSREEWDDLVDSVLEERREVAQMSNQDALVQIREALRMRYDEFRNELAEM